MRRAMLVVMVAAWPGLLACSEDAAAGEQDAVAADTAGEGDDATKGGDAAEPDAAEPDAGPPPPPDRDDDGVPDDDDRFPDDRCEAADLDGDGVGDAADPDRDGDGVDDRWERWMGTDPRDPLDRPPEVDGDGDGVPDYRDPFPGDAARSADLDGDGLDDAADDDDDNDGVSDADEVAAGTDPRGLVERSACALAHGPGWYGGDFHGHSAYSEDARKQGGEWMEEWIAVHEYYQDPRFLAVHPEYQGRPLHFQALTDHRTIEGAWDPAFASDKVLFVPSIEAGGPQHSNAHNIKTYVSHDLLAGETSYTERVAAMVAQTHWQGGIFTANHPCNDGSHWVTPTEDLDAIEVWNAPWSTEPAAAEASLDAEVADRGTENPYIRWAILRADTSSNAQALALWELMHIAGHPIALVGGSDRHMLFAPGLPTTRVWADQLTGDDILDGVRARRTVISRNPAAIKLEATVSPVGAEAQAASPVGSDLTLAAGAAITLTVRLERAAGATIQIVGGPMLDDPSPEVLLASTGPEVLLSHTLPADGPEVVEWQAELTPPSPGWFYLRVLEPIDTSGLSEASRAKLDDALGALEAGISDLGGLVAALLPLFDGYEDILLGFEPCTEAAWKLDNELPIECFLVDQTQLPTFLFPDVIDKVLNYWGGEQPAGEHALGVLTSAWTFRPAP